MTKRSIFIGLLCAVLLSVITYFNDMVMKGTFLVGNYLPVAVFGTLILFLLLVNPLLRKLSRRLSFSGRELATIVALVLFACYLPGRGLLHFFSTSIMLPHHHLRTKPSWQNEPATIAHSDVMDWQKLEQILAGSETEPALSALQKAVESSVDREATAPPSEGIENWPLLGALNQAIAETTFALQPGVADGLELTPYVEELLSREHDILSSEDRQAINRGVIDVFLAGVVVPHRLGPLARAPARMLGDISRDSTRTLDGFVAGLAQGEAKIPYSDVPWHAWTRALLFWMPLILTVCVMVVGLGLVLHRQWTTHEHLPYPTVEFARSLLPDDDSGWSPVMRSRLFWLGALVVLAIHMNNYACVWWPDNLIPVKTVLDLEPLLKLFPVLERGGAWGIFKPTIIFTAVGFAYFLATDVSLSLGLAPYLYCLIAGVLAGYGVAMGTGHLQVSLDSSFYAGAYFGMFAVLLYTGRHYYVSALRRGVGLRSRDEIEASAVWGMRIFLVTVVLFIFQLSLVGLDWQLSTLYVLTMLVIFTVISRLLAEAGVFFVHSYFYPCAMIWAFMGARAAGPNQLLVLAMLSGLLMIDPREAMMPFAMSGIHLVDRLKLRIGKTTLWGLVALVLGFVIATPVIIHLQYQRGAILASDWWSAHAVPTYPYDVNVQMTRRLEAQGALDRAYEVSGWERFTEIDPDGKFLVGFAAMFAMVILFSFLRYRFAKWPLHPLIFLVLGTFQSRILAFSFLLGYFIKSAVTRHGGAGLYRKLKPLMIGLIAGEMLAAVIPVVIGAIYYAVQGEPPKPFRIMPG
ncbi:MAG: hypothetical protein ISS31_01800 [Kiritimatiellae bacterium]|nr:hypothetical protein [Kiritimatiellia bacterium]